MKLFFITLIVFFLLSLSGWFYWFQWRPTQIRKACFVVAQNIKKTEFLKAMGVTPTAEDRNTAYRNCLTEKGLKAENL